MPEAWRQHRRVPKPTHRVRRLALASLLGLLGPLALPAQAHLLKVFAYMEGDTIHGVTYFSGGQPATGARIRIHGADAAVLAEPQPDARGEFVVSDLQSDVDRVVADTGDGHVAEWTLDRPDAPGVATTEGDTGTRDPAADRRTLALIERAVARQIGPLRAEVQSYADRLRLSDLLGGLGFIFGLAGVGLWWRSRKSERGDE